MPEIRLLLADVDGTLVDQQKVLTPRAIAAVQALRAHGIHFAITSGRPPKGMAMLVEPLALDGVMAGFNGGVFTRPDLTVIESKTLPEAVARTTLAAILDHGLDAWVYTADEWLIRDANAPHREKEEHTVRFAPRVVPGFDDVLGQAVKIVGVGDDLDLVARCEHDVQQAVGDGASAARSQPYYLDVTHHDANKGFVADYLARQMGLAIDQIATIGDMPNDVNMFRRSGLSIAMGQASDEVKAQATHTTDGYNDEGFAKAVEKFILPGTAGVPPAPPT